MSKKSVKRKVKKELKKILSVIFLLIISSIFAYFNKELIFTGSDTEIIKVPNYEALASVPEYSGEIYVQINNNKPFFEENDYKAEVFEKYSDLDRLDRCGVAFANICKETMPKEGDKRGDISRVKPTGWIQKKYNGEYLYNRCHLIGYQLSDEDDNELNLITGTRYFNVSGMLPFENQVAEYVKSHLNNHVLYRITPDFKGNNLLANGIEMEAYSVEDNGEGVCYNVYVYNVQPGITIDYKTGDSSETK